MLNHQKPCATRLFKHKKERKLQYQWYHNFRSYVVRMTGHDLHFRPGMDENRGIAGPLPGDQQSTGLLDLIRSSPAALTETIKGRHCLPFII